MKYSLKSLFATFLKLGSFTFGGYMVIVILLLTESIGWILNYQSYKSGYAEYFRGWILILPLIFVGAGRCFRAYYLDKDVLE